MRISPAAFLHAARAKGPDGVSEEVRQTAPTSSDINCVPHWSKDSPSQPSALYWSGLSLLDQYDKIQKRLDALYVDELDGAITGEF